MTSISCVSDLLMREVYKAGLTDLRMRRNAAWYMREIKHTRTNQHRRRGAFDRRFGFTTPRLARRGYRR